MNCELIALQPSLGPLSISSTVVVLTIDTKYNIHHDGYNISLNGNITDYHTNSANIDNNGFIFLNTTIPSLFGSSGFVLIEISPCVGSFSYNYYNESEIEVKIPTTTIGSLGGTTIEVLLNYTTLIASSTTTLPLWYSDIHSIMIQLSTLSIANNKNSVNFVLYKDPKITNYLRFVCTSTEIIQSLGLNQNTTLSISLNNGFHYLNTTSTLFIQERTPIRVLFMYNSLVDDHGWTNAHNNAKLLAAQYFSVALDINFLEVLKIYDGGYIEKAANSGNYDIIFVCTDFKKSIMVPIAESYPAVTFVLVSNDAFMAYPPIRHNLIYTTVNLNEAIYLTGVVAGNMIKSGGSVCFVKGFDVSSVQQGLNAFAIGLWKYNPTAQIKTTTINNWADLFQERQSAEKFYNMGCDLISHQTSHAETMKIFTTQNKYGVGVYSESRSLLGENVLTSGVFNWTPGHIELLQKALDGQLFNLSLVKGYFDNAAYASPLSGRVPERVKRIYEREKAALIDNGFFCGPIYDDSNSSIPRIPANYCAQHQDLYDMTWTMKGIKNLGIFQPIPPPFEDNRLDNSLTTAYIVITALFYTLALAFAAFLYMNKTHAALKFAQPFFLYIVLFGCCIGISAVIPLTIDVHISDSYAYSQGNDLITKSFPTASRACMSVPWLIIIGYGFVLPVLVAKSHRQHVMLELAMRSIRRTISVYTMLPYILFSLLLSIIPVIIWTIRDPILWHIKITGRNEYDMPVASIGECSSTDSSLYLILLAVYLLISFSHAYIVSVETRLDEDVNKESEKIMYTIGNMSQTIIIASLLLILLYENTQARFVIFATAIIMMFGGTMLIIFVPKVYSFYFRPNSVQKVKITLEGARLRPTGIHDPSAINIGPAVQISPVVNYFSRSLFPSVAANRFIQDSIVPADLGPGHSEAQGEQQQQQQQQGQQGRELGALPEESPYNMFIVGGGGGEGGADVDESMQPQSNNHAQERPYKYAVN